jgi:Uma2 family endonuclease
VEIEFLMARRHAIIDEENLRIPKDAFTFEGFERWIDSGDFPETGRIDYLEGDVEVDMSPEDIYTHGTPKIAISSKLHILVAEAELGFVVSDSTRLKSRFADLSVEPDVIVVLSDTLKAGKVRSSPASRRKSPVRYSGLDGAPDLVVEVVSDGSVKKDTQRLPPLYARAGIPELWLVDARSEDLRFEIHTLHGGRYEIVRQDEKGWVHSPRLQRFFRLVRRELPDLDARVYKLEDRER